MVRGLMIRCSVVFVSISVSRMNIFSHVFVLNNKIQNFAFPDELPL